MPFRSSSNSIKSQESEFEYHLRIYREGDKQQVHELFENAMFWHAHSPLRPFLKVTARSPVAKVLYLTSAVGALLWPSYPTLGPVIVLAAAGAALLQMGLISHLMLKMTRKNLQGDLADIKGYYELVSNGELADPNGPNRDLQPSGPKAFWVVEATHKITGRRELAGCGGIDVVQKDGKTDVELRRVAVSGHHLRRGIAATIVRAAIAHAKQHALPSIYLSTSNVQKAAIAMYKKFGWIEEKRRYVGAFGASVQVVCMHLHLRQGFKNEA